MVGILVGNALGSSNAPDPTAAQLAELSESVAALRSETSALASTVAEDASASAAISEAIGARIGAVEEQITASTARLDSQIGTIEERIMASAAGLESRIEAVAGRAAEISGNGATLAARLDGMAERMAVLSAPAATAQATEETATAAAPPAEPAEPSPPEPDPAIALAEAAGPNAVVLSVGQTATVSEQRVFLSRIAGDGVDVVVVGQGSVSISRFESPVDLGNDCSLAFVGAAGGKAFLRPRCAGEALEEAPAAVAAEEALATAAAEEAPATAAAEEAPAAAVAEEVAPELPDVGPDGLVLRVGQTAAVRDQAVFLSRITDETAHLHLVGSAARVEAGAFLRPVDLGNGCLLSLAGIVERTAYLAADCAEMAEAAAEPAAIEISSKRLSLGIGQTVAIGETRVFLSRLSPDEAHLFVVGEGPATAGEISGPLRLANGCTLSYGGVEDGRVVLFPAC